MRPDGTIRRGGLAVALLVCGAAVAAWGQAPPPPSAFSGTTQVLSIDVPVQVVRDGEPVRGLQAADFQVWEGRRRLAVTGFESLDLAAPAAAGPSSGRAAGVPAAARRHFLFLFDLAFSEPRSIARARQAAAGLLSQLHPTDLVAVATYSSLRGPQLVLGYTADRRQIGNALASLGLPDLTPRAVDPLRLVLQEMLGVGNTIAGVRPLSRDPLADVVDMATMTPMEMTQGVARADRSALKTQVDLFTRSLSDLARQLAVVEGRKYLIFLSEGFDADLLEGVASADRQDEMRELLLRGESWRVSSEERYGLTETANAVERMIEEFRRADCTIQAVDIGGLRAGADQGPPRAGGRDSLLMMARGTGGELYESFNDLGVAMSQMLRRTSVTYVLAVEPEKGSDSDFHRLRVVLNSPSRGARLVHRPGYYPPKPYAQEDLIEKLLAAANQVMSGEESDGVGAAVLAAPFRSAGEKAYVPVLIAIDGPSLLAGPQPAALPVEIYAYALDEGGAVHDFFTQTVGLDLARSGSPVRQSGLQFFGHVDLLPGDYSLRVLVRNGANGASGLKVLPLRVPAFEQGEPLLLPPLLPAAPSNALLVREEPRGEGAPPANPFLLRDQPFVPAVKPALAPGREVRVVLAGYNLGAGPWKGVATVVAAGGREIPGGNLAITGRLAGTAGGPDRAVATFRLPADLAPGDYEMRITLTGAAPRTSSLRFSVPRNPAKAGGGGAGR
ncbi:MAG TPA: VWA domain-containing protein [Thermoanaerobaculia bacterium]|jgi:VWFA-related protein|nr:VWA domain-containing protein [Thermoanaerobaculia bacterium]